MSTRAGTTVSVKGLIEKAIELAKEVAEKPILMRRAGIHFRDKILRKRKSILFRHENQ